MSYSPDSRFVYPYSYHPKSSLELFLISDRLNDVPHEIRERDLDVATPRTIITQYTNSHLGRWQCEQPPRYTNFHKDLPDLVTPKYIAKDSSFQHTFGQAWLKNLVSLGHLGAIGDDNHLTVEDRFPHVDISDVIDPSDTQATDLHPVGHMVRTSVVLNETLQISQQSPYALSSYATYLTTSAMALHDIGENEHPGVIVETGEVVGDISAAKGKTAANRAQERKILESILNEEFSDYFNKEMTEIMSHLIGHRINELDKEYVYAHSIQEIAHNLNSLRTGLFAANVGIWCANVLARHRDNSNDEGIFIVGHSMAMAEQHVKVLAAKFNEVREVTPELYSYYNDIVVSDDMAKLEQKVHALDDNKDFLNWRKLDAITHYYGEYSVRSL